MNISSATRCLILDYETYSETPLAKVGVSEYSRHQSTRILCVGYRLAARDKIATAKTCIWSPLIPRTEENFNNLVNAFANPDVAIVAHNAQFERAITENVFFQDFVTPEIIKISASRWHCTAALSRAMGFPSKLADVADALKLNLSKDKDGHRLMLKLSKPDKKGNRFFQDPGLLNRLTEYCKRDVDVEAELFSRLEPLTEKERTIWCLDQTVNNRGVAVDRPLIKNALELLAFEKNRIDSETKKVTRGKVKSARQVKELKKFLQLRGCRLSNMRADTVKEAIASPDIDALAKKLLEFRLSISKSSTAKYEAMEMRSRFDGRVRDNTIYFGAHTGRQSGSGVQPQNLFKSVISKEDLEVGLELMRRCDRNAIEALFGRPMDLYASALRSMLIASPGYTLDVGDFSTVEVRALFWLAGHEKGLQAFRDGRDLYIEMSAYIYGIDVGELLKQYALGDSDAKFKRQLGKQAVLGAGFGIGVGGEKFQDTCKKYGMDISLELAQKAVRTYRNVHAPIPAFWGNVEKGAMLAVANRGRVFKVGYLHFSADENFLRMKLPSGRSIFYYKPQIALERKFFGVARTLSYIGVNPKNKKFERMTTWGGKVVENAVQGVARDQLMEAQLRLEKDGRSLPVLGIHDENISERKVTPPFGSLSARDINSKKGTSDFLKLMGEVPDWAQGLPVAVEGWSAARYRK